MVKFSRKASEETNLFAFVAGCQAKSLLLLLSAYPAVVVVATDRQLSNQKKQKKQQEKHENCCPRVWQIREDRRGKEAAATDRVRVRVTFRVSLLFILLRFELYACCYLFTLAYCFGQEFGFVFSAAVPGTFQVAQHVLRQTHFWWAPFGSVWPLCFQLKYT